MSDWALDPATGDLALGNGRVGLVTEDDAIAQDWALRLGTIAGEWFRDRRKGLDLEVATGKMTRGRVLAIRAMVRTVTLATRGIVAVRGITMSLNRATRNLTVNVSAVKDNGAVVPLSSAVGVPEGGA